MLNIKQIIQAVSIISKKKSIPESKILSIIELAIKTAYKKDYGSKDEEVNVKIDMEKESIELSIEKTVVREVSNPHLEISFEELGDDAKNFQEGDLIEIDVTDEIQKEGESFGRIASQAARQVLIQKIGDTEKEKIYDLFEGKQGQVIGAKVYMLEGNKLLFDYIGNYLVLSKSEQVSRDDYSPGNRFYLYIAEVSKSEGGFSNVVLSRKRPELVGAIFKEYIPEIEDGTIKIEKIVRYPGVKTKILVSTEVDSIDPVGTMIGQKGSRVKSVMDEISGEKIDIISANDELADVVKKSLSPAEILRVDINEEENLVVVYISNDQRAKALGKNGVNINLASKLIGYKISLEDVKAEEE